MSPKENNKISNTISYKGIDEISNNGILDLFISNI